MDDEETALKKKLDSTDNSDERREIRKKLREVRNRKFNEEIQKISSGEITESTYVSDLSSRTSIKKLETTADDDGDPYGLLVYTTEQALQNLLSETPFSDSDKRRKIRARMRAIRNAELEIAAGLTLNAKLSSIDNAKKNTANTEVHISDNTVREPLSEPLGKASPDIARETSPEPIREPSPELIKEPSSEPVREPSPEPVRVPSPEPVREPSPAPVMEPTPEPVKELSPEIEKETTPPSPIDLQESDKEDSEYEGSESSDIENVQNSSNNEETDETKENFNDLDDELMDRQESQVPLNLERTPTQGGVQVDFRSSLRRKAGSPIVNLERRTSGPEQIDFRNALARKVEAPVKKEIVGGEQVDFRTALKKKVEKPVFDKTLESPAQVDFRTALSRKVQTRTIEDKNLEVEQKDFRVVLGKGTPERTISPNIPSPRETPEPLDSTDSTRQRKKSVKKAPPPPPPKKNRKISVNTVVPSSDSVEQVKDPSISQVSQNSEINNNDISKSVEDAEHKPIEDRIVEDCERKSAEDGIVNDSEHKPVQTETTEDSENVKGGIMIDSEPVVNGIIEDSEHDDRQELNIDDKNFNEKSEELSEDEIMGKPRNKKIARAEQTEKMLSNEKVENAATEKVNNANAVKKQENGIETLNSDGTRNSRRSKRSEDVTNQARAERNSRRARRLQALDDKKTNEGKDAPVHADNSEKKDEITNKIEVSGNHKENGEVISVEEKSESEVSTMNRQKGIMSRIIFGSDDEAEKNEVVDTPVKQNAETVVFTPGKVDSDNEDGDQPLRRGSRRSRKAKDEKIEVSSDLLAEINKPKEEPKKISIESQLKKTSIRSTTPLTGKAAEREAERLKREKEREERAAARAKEREEIARKRRETKLALERKMEEAKRQRSLKLQKTQAGIRATRNAFKEKLEANSPVAPGSPSLGRAINSNVSKLLGWVRTRTNGYEGVNVENASESWADGLAFAALIHSFCPEDIPIGELSKDTRRRNFELAFKVASREGVLDLLDVEDMVKMRSPDPKSIITYLHSIYDVFYEEES